MPRPGRIFDGLAASSSRLRSRCVLNPSRRLISAGASSTPPPPPPPPRTSTIAELFSSSATDSSQRKAVSINGLVRSVRSQKGVAFASVGDGTTLQPLQVVMDPKLAVGLACGAAVSITGDWVASLSPKKQSHELHALQVSSLGHHDAATYPLQKKFHTTDFLRTIPHLRVRLPFNALLIQARSHLISDVTAFFHSRSFVQTHPPVITSADCEGAGEVFGLKRAGADSDFFRRPKYLTVSAQLHLEALAQSVGNVWALTPVFRADRSDTPRHLSEFHMLEAEMCYVDNLASIVDFVEDLIRSVADGFRHSAVGQQLQNVEYRTAAHVLNDQLDSAADTTRRLDSLLTAGPWLRITYDTAMDRLRRAVDARRTRFDTPPRNDKGLAREHERFIVDDIGRGRPVFVTHYPASLKPFYMLPTPPLPPTTTTTTTTTTTPTLTPNSSASPHLPTAECFDLLVPGYCELVGGSLREHRHPQILQAMRDRGMLSDADDEQARLRPVHGARGPAPTRGDDDDGQASDLQWYTDLRRYGSAPHGGFGLGFDRLLGFLAGVPNLREVVAFPRWTGRCDC